MKTATPSVFVAGNKEGEGRVLNGDYAYFAESSTIEYMVERNCDLMQVGQWLDSKGYGIGLPQGERASRDVSKFSRKRKMEFKRKRM